MSNLLTGPQLLDRVEQLRAGHRTYCQKFTNVKPPRPWVKQSECKRRRGRVLHFNTTCNPSAAWVIPQLREAFPYDTARKYLIVDRDAILGPAVVDAVKAMGIESRRTAYRSPWQNPVAERWIGSCRRELLEHIVVFGRRHLVRLVASYITYYHVDRCHLGHRRPIRPRPSARAKVVALARVGGVHRRYEWREVA